MRKFTRYKRGENHPRHKLLDAEVDAIYILKVSGDKYSCRKLSRMFGISKSQVWNIVKERQRVAE